jgi:TonB family protein
MKTKSRLLRTACTMMAGALATLAGCASYPTRQATTESLYTSAMSASDGITVQAPVPLRRVIPIYPFELRCEGLEGIVNVSCLVDEYGRVQEAKAASSTDPRFDVAAVAAVRQWTFTPGRRDGVPAPARVSLPIRFKLQE